MLCVYSYLVRLIAELYIHTLYWFPSVDAVLSLPFVRLALMFMHSQCVYVQCVICVYCVHVYPLDVHYYYPLDKEERSYSVFSPISTATNCCTSNNEKERERDGIYRLHSRPPSALPVSVTKWTWGPNKQKQWKTQKKGSKQLTNPFLFWWLQASRWFLFVVSPSLSLFFLCTQDSRLVFLSFFVVLRCFTTANFYCSFILLSFDHVGPALTDCRWHLASPRFVAGRQEGTLLESFWKRRANFHLHHILSRPEASCSYL